MREILDPADPLAAAGYRLLWRTFHQEEVVGLPEWRNALREQHAKLVTDIRWHLVVAVRNGSVIGVTTGSYLGNVNMGFIGYLAVSPRARQQGVGPKLRARLSRVFQRDARQVRDEPLKAIVGEVRRDNPWLRTLIRRPEVLALDFHYLQPKLRAGARPVRLVLYYESMHGDVSKLSSLTLQKLLFTVWRRIYRIGQPLDTPAFRRMLRDLAGRRDVREIPLASLPTPAHKTGA